MRREAPSTLEIPELDSLGTFRLAGERERTPSWLPRRKRTPEGEFVSIREVPLSNAIAGITGSHRYTPVFGELGVADVVGGDTSRESIVGAGPLIHTISLTATERSNVTASMTVSDDNAVGTITWSNPTNAAASDDSRATAAAGVSHYLKGLNPGFAIGGSAVIKGVKLSIERRLNVTSLIDGHQAGGTFASDNAVGTRAWSNPGNAGASDGSDATALASGDELTEYLKITNFGFAAPTGVSILGVEAIVERAASAGPVTTSATLAGTGANVAGYGTTAWTNPSRLTAADNSRANATGGSGGTTSQYLRASNFGFSLPTDASILGIESTVNRRVVEASANSTKAGATFVSDNAVGTVAWTSAGNVGSSDDADASAVAVAAAITEYLKVTNFGFAIPADATVDGIEMIVEKAATQGAAPSYRAAGSSSWGGIGGGTITPGVPASIAALELMVCVVHAMGDSDTPVVTTTPSGWTSLGTTTQDFARFQAFYKIAGASEPGTYEWIYSGSGNKSISGQIYAIQDSANAAPSATLFAAAAAGGSTLSKSSITTSVNNSTVFDWIEGRGSGGTGESVDGAMVEDISKSDGELVDLMGSIVDVVAGTVAARTHTVDTAVGHFSFTLEVQPIISGDVTDQTVKLVDELGAVVGTNKADTSTAWPSADGSVTYGGASDTWSAGLTPANVNDADFGAVISADLPDGATAFIDYVTIKIYYTTTVTDDRIRIVNSAGTIGTEDKASASAWPTSEATATYGGAADDWGETWTPADINDADFGMVLVAAMGEGADAQVDWVKIAVTYQQDGVVDSVVKMVVAGAVVGDNMALAGAWPSTDTNQTYGGGTALWGATPTAAQVNATTFGIVISAAVEDGVTAAIDYVSMKIYFSASCYDTEVKLVDGGAVQPENKASVTAWAETEDITAYGGANDMWGVAWTPTKVNAATFGAVLSATVLGDALGEVDHMEVTIYYTEAGEPKQVSKIFSAGPDSNGQDSRYIYAMAGSNVHVIDPTDDSEAHVEAYAGTINTGDAAKWLGKWWLAFSGVASDFAEYIDTPWDGSTFSSTACDFEATHFEAGPDALYRSYNDFATPNNKALVRKTENVTETTVAADANWTPTNGEQMGDPGIGVTRMATLGERLIIGKEDGVGELDADYTFRSYLRWQQPFQWEYNSNGLLPLGQGGEFISTHRRGLWWLPRNRSIGLEGVGANHSDKQGRYTALAFDGHWIYAAIYNPSATDPTIGETHIIKMRRRTTEGPTEFEHHPIATIDDTVILDFYLWPGAVVGATVYGPRLYFGAGVSTLGYFKLGDEAEYNATWSIEWPEDVFGDPKTLKRPYKLSTTYRHVEDTDGISWEYIVGDPHEDQAEGEHTSVGWEPFTANGKPEGSRAVAENGFHQRFGQRDARDRGRHMALKVTGAGGLSTLQQHLAGDIFFSFFEQPETIQEVATAISCERMEGINDSDAIDQYNALEALQGQVIELYLRWPNDDGNEMVSAFVRSVSSEQNISSPNAAGVIIAQVTFDVLDFNDDFDADYPN